MENKEVLEELKKTNEKLDELIWYQKEINGHQEYINGDTSSIYKELSNKTTENYTIQILSLIFGFLVGYFLVKSFFDSYRY